ncbi:DUF5714 domain-containing protein [Ihubacter sp. mB4P-1]|uniref:DUF5714 domain-containing protein n=1 Tax=Ihubacter sp. mB4P-1 TaxID=3242370 RepID=UPI001379EAF2
MHKIDLKQEIFDSITEACLRMYRQGEMMTADQSLMRLMDLPGIPMHYPYHHYIMPAAFLTMAAIEDGSGEETLTGWLSQAEQRAKTVPGGFCGNCGSCGAGVGAGIFLSVYTGAAPVKRENWNLANEITGRCLIKIASYPGPRCCKRTLFLAAQECCAYIEDKLGLHIAVSPEIKCHYYKKNPDCLGEECPFFRKEENA